MKKIFSVFLAVILMLSAFSFSAFSFTSGNYIYELENGKAVITGFTGANTNLIIPNIIDGYEVLAIGENAFKNNTKLASITIADGICEIRDSVFENCTSLNTISLPKTLIRFGENAILNTAYYNNEKNWTKRYDKTADSDLTIGNGQDTYPWEFIQAEELEYIYLDTVLVKCHVVGSYSVKSQTTVIADGAFRGENGLEKISISAQTVTVGANAFYDCTSLDKINFGALNCKFYDDALYNTALYNNESNWKGDFLCSGKNALMVREDADELTIGAGISAYCPGLIGTKDIYTNKNVTNLDLKAFDGTKSVIYGSGGSYAETFANQNGFCFVDLDSAMLGDMDYNNELTVNDYAIYYATVTCSHKLTKYENMVGDLNLDKVIDSFDIIYLEILINDKTAKIKGDANGDGIINQKDYDYIKNYIFCDRTTVGENAKYRCDVNGDGSVDAFDLIYLDLYLNGKASL